MFLQNVYLTMTTRMLTVLTGYMAIRAKRHHIHKWIYMGTWVIDEQNKPSQLMMTVIAWPVCRHLVNHYHPSIFVNLCKKNGLKGFNGWAEPLLSLNWEWIKAFVTSKPTTTTKLAQKVYRFNLQKAADSTTFPIVKFVSIIGWWILTEI